MIFLYINECSLSPGKQEDPIVGRRISSIESTIVNDIRNFVFGLAEAAVCGSCRSRKQYFVMSITITIVLHTFM